MASAEHDPHAAARTVAGPFAPLVPGELLRNDQALELFTLVRHFVMTSLGSLHDVFMEGRPQRADAYAEALNKFYEWHADVAIEEVKAVTAARPGKPVTFYKLLQNVARNYAKLLYRQCDLKKCTMEHVNVQDFMRQVYRELLGPRSSSGIRSGAFFAQTRREQDYTLAFAFRDALSSVIRVHETTGPVGTASGSAVAAAPASTPAALAPASTPASTPAALAPASVSARAPLASGTLADGVGVGNSVGDGAGAGAGGAGGAGGGSGSDGDVDGDGVPDGDVFPADSISSVGQQDDARGGDEDPLARVRLDEPLRAAAHAPVVAASVRPPLPTRPGASAGLGGRASGAGGAGVRSSRDTVDLRSMASGSGFRRPGGGGGGGSVASSTSAMTRASQQPRRPRVLDAVDEDAAPPAAATKPPVRLVVLGGGGGSVAGADDVRSVASSRPHAHASRHGHRRSSGDSESASGSDADDADAATHTGETTSTVQRTASVF